VPFNLSALDSILHEKREDGLGDVVGGIGGGRAGRDGDPDGHWTESLLPVLLDDEASRADGRVPSLLLHQVANLGTDGVPDLVERCVEHATERLDGERGVSARGASPGIRDRSCTVEEVGVVAVVGDAVVVGDSFEVRDRVTGRNSARSGRGVEGESVKLGLIGG